MNNETVFKLLNKVNELNHVNSGKIKLKNIQIHPKTSDDKISSLEEIFGKTLSALPTGTQTDFGKASPNTNANENPINMQEVQAFLRKQFQKISSETEPRQVKDFTISKPLSVRRPLSTPVNLHPSKDFKQASVLQRQDIKAAKRPSGTFSPIVKNVKKQADVHHTQSIMPISVAHHKTSRTTMSAAYPNEKSTEPLMSVSLTSLPLKHLNAKRKPKNVNHFHAQMPKAQKEITVSNTDFSRDKASFSAGVLPVHHGKSQQENSIPAAAPVLFPKPERDALLAILQAIHDKLPGKSTYRPAPVTTAKYVAGQNHSLMNALRQTIR